MAVHFDRQRMESVADNHDRWWRGKLNRPLLRGVYENFYQPSHIAKVPRLSQATCHDFSLTAEEVIDAEDAFLSTCQYFADGYPVMDFAAFGPGVLAAMLGSELDNSRGQIWFLPCEEDVSKLHVRYDPENKWVRRIKDLYRAGLERWQGTVIMTMPDLGGIMDILASLIGSENLVFALVDEPEEVMRVQNEIQAAWYEAYWDFRKVLEPQGMYTDWNGILSREPSYIPQCDFSYMLGPDMFAEFVMPMLREDTNRLTNTIYHLDGVGELKHLDMLLTLPNLKAIQWVYGVGQPGPEAWGDVYRKILDAGKQVMIIENVLYHPLKEILPHAGISPYMSLWASPEHQQQVEEILRLCNIQA